MTPELKLFKKTLQRNRNYITDARIRLFRILQRNPALSIPELIKLSAKHDQATVYRNLILFERLGVVTQLRLGWNSKVELTDKFAPHHHHLVCINCQKIVALPEDNNIESAISMLGAKYGYTQLSHQLEIQGLCMACQRRQKQGSQR